VISMASHRTRGIRAIPPGAASETLAPPLTLAPTLAPPTLVGSEDSEG